MLEPAEAIQTEDTAPPRCGCAVLCGYFLLLVMGGAMWAGLVVATKAAVQ